MKAREARTDESFYPGQRTARNLNRLLAQGRSGRPRGDEISGMPWHTFCYGHSALLLCWIAAFVSVLFYDGNASPGVTVGAFEMVRFYRPFRGQFSAVSTPISTIPG